jgi:hypothetical protein
MIFVRVFTSKAQGANSKGAFDIKKWPNKQIIKQLLFTTMAHKVQHKVTQSMNLKRATCTQNKQSTKPPNPHI